MSDRLSLIEILSVIAGRNAEREPAYFICQCCKEAGVAKPISRAEVLELSNQLAVDRSLESAKLALEIVVQLQELDQETEREENESYAAWKSSGVASK